MKRIIIITMLAICCLTCLISCNKDNDNSDGGNTSLSISVNFHSENTINSNSFSNYIGNTVSVPVNEGNTFLGYYTADGVQYFDKNGSQISGLIIADGMHLYARFQPYKYTLELHAQTGKFEDNTAVKTVDVFYGEKLSEKIPDVLNANTMFELDGYFDSKGEKRYTNGTEAQFDLLDYANGDTIKLYAKFKVKELTVTLDFNDGITWPETFKANYGDKIGDLEAYKKTNGDKEIALWSTSPMFEQALPEALTEDITIFAIWRKHVTVDFMYPDNTVKSHKVYIAEGKTSALPAVITPGYKLLGWYDNEQFSGNPITEVPYGSLKSQYYGKWAEIKYTVTFDTAGGEEIADIDYSYGEDVTLPRATNGDLLFCGWKNKKDGKIYTKLPSTMWGNLELSAVFVDFVGEAITCAEDFDKLRENPYGSYILVTDIDMYGIVWQRIEYFYGTLDGNGYSINNLTISSNDKQSAIGFIADNNGTLMNLTFKNANLNCVIKNSPHTHATGTICCVNFGKIVNCHVVNSQITYDFSTPNSLELWIGGLVGTVKDGTVDQCTVSSVVITGQSAGGTCVMTGLGIGRINAGVVSNCYAEGALNVVSNGSGGIDPGEFVGYVLQGGKVINSYSNVKISKTGSTGSIIYDFCDFNKGTVENCFAAAKLEKSQATSPNYIYGTLGWDREIWEVVEGEYPKLKCFND